MKKYDVFISYAVEDKNPIATEIANGLRQHGLKVYFASDELGPGDSVSETVYDGLERSSYFVPVLSRNYVRRWTTIEWSSILWREKKTGRKLIFPVWHSIGLDDVKQLFPELIDHYAKPTNDGMQLVVSGLAAEIKKRKAGDARRRRMKTAAVALLVALVFAVARTAFSFPAEANNMPSMGHAEELVRAHIDAFQEKLDFAFLQKQEEHNVTPVMLDSVKRMYSYYNAISEHSRNDYYFASAQGNVFGRGDIEALGIVLQESPHHAYGISASFIREIDRRITDTTGFHLVAFGDTTEVQFEIDTMYYDVRTHDVHLWVSYDRYLRYVYYTLNYSSADAKIRQHVRLEGFRPEEEYILSNQSGRWEVQTVK